MLGRLFINKKRIEIKTVNTDYPLIMLYADAGRKRIGTLKAVIVENSCALGDIDIPLEYVNLGAGSKLIEKLEDICKQKGLTEIKGELSDVDIGHKDRLIHFYEKHGYTVVYENNKPGYWGTITKKI